MNLNLMRFIGAVVLVAPWATLIGRTDRVAPEDQPALMIMFVLAGIFCGYWVLRVAFADPDRPIGLLVLVYTAFISEFLGGFAYTYWHLGGSNGCFSEALSKVDAIYFTITTFTTTGFGDLRVSGDACRGVVIAQMVVGFIIVSIGIATAISRRK